jgi:hypothetical protein
MMGFAALNPSYAADGGDAGQMVGGSTEMAFHGMLINS